MGRECNLGIEPHPLQGSHYTEQEGDEGEGLALFYSTKVFKCIEERHVLIADSFRDGSGNAKRALLRNGFEPGECCISRTRHGANVVAVTITVQGALVRHG
jgi:hypothetical protein